MPLTWFNQFLCAIPFALVVGGIIYLSMAVYDDPIEDDEIDD